MYLDLKNLSRQDQLALTKAIRECGFIERPAPIDFSEAVPLDSAYVMSAKVIDAGTSFYPAGKRTQSGSCYLRLIGDGSVSPNFRGMAKDSTSTEYLVDSGAINCVLIWFDGTQVMYRISHAANYTSSPAVASAGQVSFNDGNKVAIYYDRPLSQLPIPDLSCFAVMFEDRPINVVHAEVNDDDYAEIVLTVDVEIGHGKTCQVSYVSPDTNPLTDEEGYIAGSFSNVDAHRSN